MFQKVRYEELNSKQQENRNFQKVSAVLADYGFSTHRVNDDWGFADFIAQHVDGVTLLKVQLKGRLTFDQKYDGKDIHVCFRHNDRWYLYPHDKVRDFWLQAGNGGNTVSWQQNGNYHISPPSQQMLEYLEEFAVVDRAGE